MSAKKRAMTCSEPTQPERPKRFTRRNSVHTLHCRTGTLNKTEPSPDLHPPTPLTQRPLPVLQQPEEAALEQEAVSFFRKMSQPIQLTLRRNTGSMKMERRQGGQEQVERLEEELKTMRQEKELLVMQGNRLRRLHREDQEAKKVLEEEVAYQRQAIRRLEKRVTKLKDEQSSHMSERERLLG